MQADTQEDLTDSDHLVTQTEKVFDADDDMPTPDQHPGSVPDSVIDENGDSA